MNYIMFIDDVQSTLHNYIISENSYSVLLSFSFDCSLLDS